MEVPVRGTLVWDTSEAQTPRWVLILDHPDDAPMRLDSQDPLTPQDASRNQLWQLIVTTLQQAHNPEPTAVALEPVASGPGYRFCVTYTY